MASTRNKNSRSDYACQERDKMHAREYLMYPHASAGMAYTTNLAGNGFGNASIPWNKLSHNPVEIENFLFGIGSTDLTKAQPPILRPELIKVTPIDIYTNPPVYMPEPLVIEKNQRPFPC